MPEDVKLYDLHEGLTGRDGGPYLDQVERHNAETRRAIVEDREPDYENAPAVAGTPLVTAAQLVQTVNPASNPSQVGNDVLSQAIDKVAMDDDFAVASVSTISGDTITGVPEADVSNANEDPTNPTGAASHPAQMPNADVTQTDGDTDVSDAPDTTDVETDSGAHNVGTDNSGGSSDTPIFDASRSE